MHSRLNMLLANELKIPHWKVSVSYGLVQLVIAVGAMYMGKFSILYLGLWLTGFLLLFALAYYIVMRKCTVGIPACAKS